MPVTAVFVIMAMVPSVRNPAFPSSFGVGRSEWIVDCIRLWRFKLDHDRFRILVLNVGFPILKPVHQMFWMLQAERGWPSTSVLQLFVTRPVSHPLTAYSPEYIFL